MKSIQRAFGLAAVVLAGAGLQAQEPWQGGFKLTAGLFPGAEDA